MNDLKFELRRALFHVPGGLRSETDEELRLRSEWAARGCMHCQNAQFTGRRCDAHQPPKPPTDDRSSVACIHGWRAEMCPECVELRPRQLSDERRSIVEYLEWAAAIEVGTVMNPEERQGVRYAAAWVRNELDRKPRE